MTFGRMCLELSSSIAADDELEKKSSRCERLKDETSSPNISIFITFFRRLVWTQTQTPMASRMPCLQEFKE